MYFYKKKQMWIFKPEEKEAAHNVSVIDYLQQNYGFTFKRDGNGFRCREHNSLFVHGDEKAWYWNSRCLGGGDVIEFVRKVENVTYAKALEIVINPAHSERLTYTVAPVQPAITEKKPLNLPAKAQGKYKRVFAYLTLTRCLDPKIVTTLMHKKFIYEDVNGNCVFVGYNKAGKAVYGAIRSTVTNRVFRYDAEGSDKENSFYLKGFDKQRIYVFESPIDALSHATLANIAASNPREWLNATRISCGGNNDVPLERFISDYPEVEKICFCYDNDKGGQKARDLYIPKWEAKGFKVSTEIPAHKDFNEDLQAIVQSRLIASSVSKK